MFVGRCRELEEIEALLDRAHGGVGGMRMLTGQAGIGKTRLADEIASRAAARGYAVCWGRAWETGGAPAYFPWIEVLGNLADSGAAPPPRVRALLGSATDSLPDEGARADAARERFELFEQVASFVRGSAKRTPLLLAFDDLHVADVPSLELLWFVARGLRSMRIAVIGTWRDAEAQLAPVADVLGRITREGDVFLLRPLTAEEVGEVVRQETGRFDAALSEALHRSTEGNPFFLREMLHAAATYPEHLEGSRDLPLGGVLALARARLAGADEGTRSMLRTAAVVGRDVSVATLAAVLSEPPASVERSLAEAAGRGLLLRRDQGTWTFSHVLVREAFYRELSLELRGSIHARIAAVLEERVAHGREELLSMLAHHAMAALPTGDVREAVRTARRAAARARGQLAHEEAMTLLERALTACDALERGDLRDRAEVLLDLGWAATEAGRLTRGRDVFREAASIARTADDPGLLARAALGQGGEYVLAEIRSELVDVLREALDALDAKGDIESTRLRARLLARLAAGLTPSATPEVPLDLARRALAAADAGADLRTRIDVDVGVGAALTDFAPPLERIPVNERLLRGAREAGDRILELRALTRLACDHLERADRAAAEAAIEARAGLAREIGHPKYLWQTPLLRSMAAMAAGRFEECERAVEEVRRAVPEANDPNAERCAELHRFCMLLVAGRSEALEAQEAPTLRVLGSLPDGAALCTWVSGIAAARAGHSARAAEALRALGPASVMSARMSRALLLDTATRAGQVDACERLYRSFAADEDSNACWGPFAFICAPPIAMLLGAAAFAMGRVEDARRHCERALLVSERMGATAHLAWTRLVLGEALRASSEGREFLSDALESARHLDMPEIAARAASALARGGSPTARDTLGVPSLRPSATPPPAGRAPASRTEHTPEFSMRRDGTHWQIEHEGNSFRVKDLRGVGMLAQLMATPGHEYHVLELSADGAPSAGEAVDLGDAGEILDARARDAYRARVDELRGEIEEAEGFGDIARAARRRTELDALTEQLAAAVGLGGRARRTGSAGERARIVVQRRIREAIRKIAEHDPSLGRHLDWTVRTGAYCAYEPQGRKVER